MRMRHIGENADHYAFFLTTTPLHTFTPTPTVTPHTTDTPAHTEVPPPLPPIHHTQKCRHYTIFL